ncbi:SLATT domain-containing protein [Cellulomonas sp. ICMP 17802]|uniref:SLATT domain-containing protein n=1 Tax=Cellulomonas sp. ICMP 17802 TaxID=3239199 RepID=UPI00351B83C8
MGPVLVPVRGGALPRRREIGVSGAHPVLAVFGSTARLEPELARSLAPALREVLRSAAARGAVVVTGGTDAGVFRLLGAAAAALPTAPRLVGVAPAGRVRGQGAPDGDPDQADLEPHHDVAVLVPGDRWGDEVPTISALMSAVARRHPAVALLVGGGDVSRAEVREHLRRDRPVVVLAGSGRLADAIADGSAAQDDADLAALLAAGAVHVVDVGRPAQVRATLDRLLGSPPVHGVRGRLSALDALPRWHAPSAGSGRQLGADVAASYPALAEAIGQAERLIVPAMRECDATALREQNRHRWYVTLGLVGGLATTVLGAVQSWLDSAAWPGVAVATVGAATSGLLTVSRRQGSLDTYVAARTRAERLRSLYFEFLTAGPDVASRPDSATRLQEEVARRQYGQGSASRAADAPRDVAPAAGSGPEPRTADDAWRAQALDLYRTHRLDEQAAWYANRSRRFDAALRATVTTSAVLLVLAAFFGALGTADAGRRPLWAVCAAACGALAATLNTYEATAGFGRLARQYADTLAAVRLAEAHGMAAVGSDEDRPGALVALTEQILLGEVNAWSLVLRQADDGKDGNGRAGS